LDRTRTGKWQLHSSTPDRSLMPVVHLDRPGSTHPARIDNDGASNAVPPTGITATMISKSRAGQERRPRFERFLPAPTRTRTDVLCTASPSKKRSERGCIQHSVTRGFATVR
jgi:hypothetical protein